MNEMVERVAEAITKAFDEFGRVLDEGQAEYLARAAIAEVYASAEIIVLPGGAKRAYLLIDEALK